MRKKDPTKQKGPLTDLPVPEIDEPTSVVSASECTGLLAFMPQEQAGANALEEIVRTNPIIVPEFDTKKKE